MSLDSGMVVVIIISMMYMVLVFGLLFYVKNEWCDLLFKNFMVVFYLYLSNLLLVISGIQKVTLVLLVLQVHGHAVQDCQDNAGNGHSCHTSDIGL